MTTNIASESASKWGLPLRRTDVAEATGRERRQTERAVDYWAKKVEAFGDNATIETLDLDKIGRSDWSNRFIISVNERGGAEGLALLLYGERLAELLGLPAKVEPHLPLARRLPRRFLALFLRGCLEAPRQGKPVRVEGEVERNHHRIEQYRAVFIPAKIRPNGLVHFIFGAFNSRVVEPPTA
jgi:hypothetical protein